LPIPLRVPYETGLTKPPAGAMINWNHPLAPRTKTGFFLPCNGGGSYPVDLVQNIRWKGITGGNSAVGYYRPVGPPNFNNPSSLRLPNTSATGYSATYIAPTTVASPNVDCTLAAIFSDTSTPIDGPRILGTANDKGVILEPGHAGGTVFNVLYGGIAHFATTIPYTQGHWYFFGVSTRSNGLFADCFVKDYTTGAVYTYTLSTGTTFATPDQFTIGGTGVGNNRGAKCDLYWGLLDHYYWGFDGMAKLAQDPWAFMTSSTSIKSLGATLAAASYLRTDRGTAGAWKGNYGTQGYYKAGDSTNITGATSGGEVSLPSYIASIAINGNVYYDWASNSADIRALQNASGNNLNAATYYSSGTWTLTITPNDSATHQLAIYAVDWDSIVRRENITVTDSLGTTLDTYSLNYNFQAGVWMVLNFSGTIIINCINTGSSNGVLSGFFFDPPQVISDFAPGGITGVGPIANYAF
jgi:hypothetical protein